MIASHYLFETVLKKLVGDLKVELEQEVVKRPEDFAEADQIGTICGVFDTFPRRLSRYCSVVSTLADLSAYAVKDILMFLTGVCHQVYSCKKCSTFSELAGIEFEEPVRSSRIKLQYIRFFELIFISDLVCTIISKHGVPEKSGFLINCGLLICASQPADQKTTHLVLDQWSVVFSMISLAQPAMLFDVLTRFIINKPEMFFVIIKFVRLDAPDCPADDLVDIMAMHVKRARQRRIISSVMLTAMSTFLMTYPGNPERLSEFMDLACEFCKHPETKPGAVDLVVSLIPKMGWSKERASEFYQEVFPMAQTAEGITSAAKALRLLMCGGSLDTEWLFWVWGPEPRTNELQFLEWSGDDDYISIFVQYFLHSKHYKVCQNLLRDIIVHLASLDFNMFMDVLFPAFVENIGKNTDRFMCFISIVPMINDPNFLKIAKTPNLTLEAIQNFNDRLGSTAAEVLAKETSIIRTFDFTSDQLEVHRQTIGHATNEVGATLDNWRIDLGVPDQTTVNKGSGPCSSPSNQSLGIVKIMPFLLNSELFQRPELMGSVIVLAALSDSSISQPAYGLVQTNLKRPAYQRQIMQQLVSMVNVGQRQAIALVCLQLLVDGLDDMEPTSQDNEDAFEYTIEFAGFLALTNKHPLTRIVGLELLQKANKLLKNSGFYSQIEANIQAIESNVKHNMLMNKFPKHPGHYGFHDGEVHLLSAAQSMYQMPWLYFLAELGHILWSSNYRPVLKRVAALASAFAENPDICSGPFRQGVLVVLCSTCFIEKSAPGGIVYASETPESTGRLHSCSQVLQTIILGKYRTQMNVALRFVNDSLVDMVINHYPFGEESLESNLTLLFHLLKSIEGHKKRKNEIFIPVFNLLLQMLEKFSHMGLNLTRDKGFCPKHVFRKLCPECPTFRENERLVLLFLSVVIMWLEKRHKESILLCPVLVFFILNWACLRDDSRDKVCERIQTYACSALVPLLEVCSCCIQVKQNREQNAKLLLACARIESRGFKVLKSMLMQNKQALFEECLMLCIIKKSAISDLFFDAVYELLPDEKASDGTVDGTIPMSLVGKFFLVGLVGLKTGSVLAKQFLLKFIQCYAAQINYKEREQLEADLQNKDISDVPAKHFVRVSEFVVAAALECLKDPKFRGAFRVIVEIMIPWVKHFRMLPNQDLCMPSQNSTGFALPARQFLDDLMRITSAKVNHREFDRLVDLWTTLLESEEQNDLVLGFITNSTCTSPDNGDPKEGAHVKVTLFVHLLDRVPAMIIKRIAQRCSFAFYAYITYEMKTPFDSEFWMIPVLTRAVSRYKKLVMPDMCSIVQFALLFHANQTQSLLKRVSKSLSVPYRRSTLSSGTIQRTVRAFQTQIAAELDGDRAFINKWALEAMRWVVGSSELKISHTSLIIVNNIEYSVDDTDITDFLQSLCKSTAFFMKQSEPGEQLMYDFINETFKVFDRGFVGHEQMCLEYIDSFIKFVVSVDAYFPNMLLLYGRCLESPVTHDRALESILDALRPSLNELEVDSKARDAFDLFVENYDTLDLELVRRVLTRSNDGDDDKDLEIVSSATLDDLNRALSHFSLMIDTASVDLRKRIFKISTLIVKKFTKVREISQSAQSSPMKPRGVKREMRALSPTSNSDSDKADDADPAREDESTIQDDRELDKQALVVIFRVAIQQLPGTREALDFVVAIAYNDPLIPTIPQIDEMNWEESVQTAVEKLRALANRDKDVVSLTLCAKLKSVSNLLDQEGRPQILPFTLQGNAMSSLKKREKSEPGNARLDGLMRRLSSVVVELGRRVSDRISPQIRDVSGVYEPLQMPTKLVTDEQLKGNRPITEVPVIISAEEFLRLENADEK